MSHPVILNAVRTPTGRRRGGLAGVHPVDLLAVVQTEALARASIDPASVDQVLGGCVTQVGEQSFNVTRSAWLAAGLPQGVAATTMDAQCGSSQQASSLAAAAVAAGYADVTIGCGVEVMSRLPIGANFSKELGYGRPIPKSYFDHYQFNSQFQAAELIAKKWGVTREEADQVGVISQQRAARAWAEGRFDDQVVSIAAPQLDGDGKPTGETVAVARDEGLRETSLEALARLKSVSADGVHTAGTSSQISDGAAAVVFSSTARAESLGVRPRARVVDACLVGVDPELMLTGPIDATALLLKRTGLQMDDMDVIEINEAFASVVLAWAREFDVDMERVNPNGGAIALGHPLGATGAILLTKALHELERTGGRYALVTMCCGGGLGTGTVIERL